MYLSADSLDDLLRLVLGKLVVSKHQASATRGDFTELFGPLLHLTNPRARLSRTESKGKLFSALGELLWYLTGANELNFIDYYLPNRYQSESDDGISVRSAYGERLLNFDGSNQISAVIDTLRRRPSSRRAVIQLFDHTDLTQDYLSIPCTCTLQFLLRAGKLSLLVNMRSNDVYFGLPHDVFAFTMLQEIIACSIGADVGEYKHCVGSLHLYQKHFEEAKAYLEEGWQSTIAMPEMPVEDPWNSIASVRDVEQRIRNDECIDFHSLELQEYWKDVCRLLAAYRAFRNRDAAYLHEMRATLAHRPYRMFIDSKIDLLSRSRE